MRIVFQQLLKMLDDKMEIESVKLIEKRGGKSDLKTRVATPLHAAVLVLSDSVSAGKKSDASGLLIKDMLTNSGIIVDSYEILPDDRAAIIDKLRDYCDKSRLDLVVTTGGTGFSPRDTTPEAMLEVIERSIPGIPEAIRAYGQQRTPYAMLSRSAAGIRGNTLILILPGSKRGVQESLDALFPALLHAFPMMRSGGHENPILKNSDD